MSLSIGLIVGDQHTLHCGVKDYAIRLGKELERIGLNAEILAPSDWGIKSFWRFREELQRRQFDILHAQYPSIGNRKSLCPHFLGWMRAAKRVVVTLHEYSALPGAQRASVQLFRWTADQVLFTTETELSRYGRSGVAQRVIHIGSNVPAFTTDKPRTPTIIYFGQIRPEKGLEEFLALAHRSQQLARPFKFQVIGSVPERRASYYQAIKANAIPEVEWLIDLPFEQIAELMAGSLAAYLPFPDGASNRRGSLLAALTNGLPVITTIGNATSRELINVVLSASNPDEALKHIDRLHALPEEAQALGNAEKLYAAKFSWTEIALQHEQAYNEMLSLTPQARQVAAG